MTRCPEGHFFDPAKHHACPWCPKPVDLGSGDGGKTTPIRNPAPEIDAGKTIPVRSNPAPPAADSGKTQPLRPAAAGRALPVVGWLVALEGPEKGQDFRLHSEKNFIGRSATMDVCIAGDDKVSRDKHATVTFEPKKQTFWLVPGESSGLVYRNGDIVHTPVQLQAGDILELGGSKLVLVPFVSDNFRWD